MLLIGAYASDYDLDSEEAEGLLKTIQDLRQVASFHFDKGFATCTMYIYTLSLLQSPHQ